MTQEEIKLFFDFWAGQIIASVFFVCIVAIIVTSVITDYLRLFTDKKKELDKNRDLDKELAENFGIFKEKIGHKISIQESLFIWCAISSLGSGGRVARMLFESGVSVFKFPDGTAISLFLRFLIYLNLLFVFYHLSKDKRIKEGIIKDDGNTGLFVINVCAVIMFVVFFGLVISLNFA